MSYTFSMTEDALAAGIKKIPDSKRAFVQEVQNLLKAGVEYAILRQNGTYLNNILEALDGRMAAIAGRYMSATGMPFEYKDSKLAFKQARALAILKNLGKHVEKPKAGEQLPEWALEALLLGVLGTMSGNMWDSEAVKADKEARKAAKQEKSVEEIRAALKKKIERAVKEAKDAGLDASEVAPDDLIRVIPSAAPATEQAPAISTEMQKVINLLSPYEGTEVMATVLTTVADILAASVKKAA